MDPAASFWEPWADVAAQKTKQPQNDKNRDNSPHEISPINDLLNLNIGPARSSQLISENNWIFCRTLAGWSSYDRIRPSGGQTSL